MNGLKLLACPFLILGLISLGQADPETPQQPSSTEVFQPQPGFDTRTFFPQISNLSRPPVPRDTDDKTQLLVGSGEPNNLRYDATTVAPRMLDREAYPETLVGLKENIFDPADCEVAVGPTYILQVINTAVMVFDKATGKVVFQQALDDVDGTLKGLFEGYVQADSIVFDPRCWYDTVAQRFFITVMEKNDRLKTSKIHLGFSKTSSPVGDWGVFSMTTGRTITKVIHWADFNTAGYNKDAIILPYLLFSFTNKFYGSDVAVIPKKTLLEQKPVTVKKFYIPGMFTIQAARTVDASVATIYGTGLVNDTTMRIYAWTGLPAAPLMSTRNVAIPKAALINGAKPARAKTGRTLDTGLDRPQQTIYQAGKVYTTLSHSIPVSGGYKVGMGFYVFDTNAYPTKYPTLNQSGLVYSTTEDWSYPTLAVNSDGDIGIAYTASHATANPAIHFASRKSTDAKGKLTKFMVMKPANTVDYKSKAEQRWGDYFGMVVDPGDSLTFWGTTMVTAGTGWTTAVFAHANRGVSNSVKNPFSFYKNEGASAVGKVTDLVSSDSKGVVLGAGKVGSNYVASIDLYTKVVGSRTRGRTLEFDVLSRGTEGVDMAIWIYNNRLHRYENLRQWKNKSAGGPLQIVNKLAPFSDYVTADGQVLINIQGYSSKTFSVNVDYVRVVFQTHKS